MYQNPVLFPQITNRESLTLPVEVTDDDTGDLVDLTGCTIALEITKAEPLAGDPWGSYYDSDYNTQPILVASIGNGITVTGIGTFQVYFSKASMRSLDRGTYDVGCVVERDVDARQLFLGRLPVFHGKVT